MKGSSKEFSTGLRVLSGVLQASVVVIFYLLIIVGIRNVASSVYNFSFEIFGNISVEAAPGRNVEVVIGNTDSKKVAALLKEKGLIANEYSFWIREKLSLTKYHQIEAGVYILNTSMNYEEILDILTNTEKEETA